MEKIGLVKAIEGDIAVGEIKRYRTRRRHLGPIPVNKSKGLRKNRS